MSILIFKNQKFDEYQGKRSKNYFIETASQFRGKLVQLFKKNIIEKVRFHFQKYDKYLKPKNDVKKLLGAFNHEL